MGGAKVSIAIAVIGPRRTIQFTDADFTDLVVDAPIEITITLGALPTD